MAVILILAGGLFGFASAVFSLVFLDANLLQALAIWIGAGLAPALLGLAVALMPPPAPPARSIAKTA